MSKKTIFEVLKTFAVFVVLILSFIFGYTYYKVSGIINELPYLDINKIHVNESTKVFDKNQVLMVELGVEKRDIVKYENISHEMVNALISIEDMRFYDHDGIDYKRIFGAIVENIKSISYSEGASTLTQQLVKLSYLTNDKTLERKIKEMFISLELEKQISKEIIIEAYLNRVLFGGRIYGIEKASKYYFNKSAKALNYEESALLAGIIQSPNRYNPYVNPEETKSRQILVLKALYNQQFISKIDLDNAINKPIEELIVEQLESNEHEKYYEYIDLVIYEIQNKYNLNPFNESLRIYTHLDTSIQDYIYEIENDDNLHPNDRTQTGIVVLETKTGIIRGIGGGRGHEGSMSFNFATDAKRQPGSTIKPILDYGPAIEYLKYSPAQPFLDEEIYFNTYGSRFVPIENYDNKYKGYLTMRDAIIDSRNVTAVKAFREVGAERAYQFANRLGIKTDERITEAHAIGGYQYGFTVMQMAAAYAPFGNGGYYHEPTTIDFIQKNGEKLKVEPITRQAMRKDTAYLMTDILRDNMVSGTAIRANVSDLIIAGKTGQTNYNEFTRKKFGFPSNSVRDSWFIGYTTKYTTAAWLGYDKIEEDAYLTPAEAKKSLEIFKKTMDIIHKDRFSSKPFTRPDNIIEVEVETNSTPLNLPNEYTPDMYRKKDLFIKGTEPSSVSSRFNPLKMPRNFVVYYDGINENIVFKWDKYNNDYSLADFEIMERVHKISNYYDYYKNKTQKEYYQSSVFNPSYLNEQRVKATNYNYCKSSSKKANLCPITKIQSLNLHLSLLEGLKNYEISILLNGKDINILNNGEISELRGYSTWNGYRNGIYSNLGAIEYRIVGTKGTEHTTLYVGPYQEEVKVYSQIDDYIEYDSFSISADYSKYRNRLKSDSNISLNPF